MEKKKIVFRNQYNYSLGDCDKDLEYNDEPSMTIPDMSYSIKEILEKYTKGIVLNVVKNGRFDEEPDFNDSLVEEQPDFDLSDISRESERITTVKGKLKNKSTEIPKESVEQKVEGSEGEKGSEPT